MFDPSWAVKCVWELLVRRSRQRCLFPLSLIILLCPGARAADRWHVLWQHPTLGLEEGRLPDGSAWDRISFVDGYVVHRGKLGEPVLPLRKALEEVELGSVTKVACEFEYRPIRHMGVPGKHIGCSINGGYRGTGHAAHGWKQLGFTANVMHPVIRDGNGVSHFTAWGGMRTKANGKRYGETMNRSSPSPLPLNEWHSIRTEIDLTNNTLALIINGTLVQETALRGNLLVDDNQQPQTAHVFLRHMAGGDPKSPEYIPSQDWEEHFRRVAIEVAR